MRKLQDEDIKLNSLRIGILNQGHLTESVTGENIYLDHDMIITIKNAILTGIGLYQGYEDLTSLVNGILTSFTLSFIPIANTLFVIHNGIVRRIGASNDYTISGKIVTFNYTPDVSTTSLIFIYRHNGV